MICPACKTRISVFSKVVNGFGKKYCPKCQEIFRMKINYFKFFGAMFLLAVAPIIFLNGNVKNISVGIACGLAVLISMEAKQ